MSRAYVSLVGLLNGTDERDLLPMGRVERKSLDGEVSWWHDNYQVRQLASCLLASMVSRGLGSRSTWSDRLSQVCSLLEHGESNFIGSMRGLKSKGQFAEWG